MTTFDPKKLSDDVVHVVRVEYEVAYRFDAQDLVLNGYHAITPFECQYDLARRVARNCWGGKSLSQYFRDAESAGQVRTVMSDAAMYRCGPDVWYFSESTYPIAA